MPISAFTDIANCEFVIDAEEAFTDAGITPAVVDGDIIQQINDTSGNAKHWTNTGTSGTRPTCLNDPYLGQRVANFSAASSQLLNVPNMFTGFTAATFLWIIRVKNDPALSTANGRWHSFTTSTVNACSWVDGLIYDSIGNPGGSWLTVSSVKTLVKWSLYHTSGQTNNFVQGLNRFRKMSVATSGAFGGFSTTPLFGVGVGTGGAWDGYLRACIMYSRFLTDTEFSDAAALAQDTLMNSSGLNLPMKSATMPLIKANPASIIGGTPEWARVIKPIGDAVGSGITRGYPILF